MRSVIPSRHPTPRGAGLLALALALGAALAGCHQSPPAPTTDSSLPSDTAPTSAGTPGNDGDAATAPDAGASGAAAPRATGGDGQVPAGARASGAAASSPR